MTIHNDQLVAVQNISNTFYLFDTEPRFIKYSEKILTTVESTNARPSIAPIEIFIQILLIHSLLSS